MKARILGWKWVGVTLVLVVVAFVLERVKLCIPGFPTLLFEILFGAIIGGLFTLYFDVLKEPDLVVRLWCQGNPQHMVLRGVNKPFHVLHLQAVNRPLPRCMTRIGLVRERVREARGWIVFRDSCGKLVEPSWRLNNESEPLRMPIRWANSLQPGKRFLVKRPEDNSLLPWTALDLERLTDVRPISPGHLQGTPGGVNEGV
ncbi:MAG TPA: hypothetical protein VMX14_12790, partial [Anaerolineae bacterium]|nr:hypothetical protein [Anaerolineae bacterium]